MSRSAAGFDPNAAAAFAYVGGPVTGLIVLMFSKSLVREREGYVRFHAMQSTVTFLGVAVVHLILRNLPVMGGVLATLLLIATAVLWIFLILKAIKGQTYKLPFVGDIAEQQLR